VGPALAKYGLLFAITDILIVPWLANKYLHNKTRFRKKFVLKPVDKYWMERLKGSFFVVLFVFILFIILWLVFVLYVISSEKPSVDKKKRRRHGKGMNRPRSKY